MNDLKPSECIACEPWGFSKHSDKARKMYCLACGGTGWVWAIPDTHRVVSVEDLRGMQWAFEDHRAGDMVDKILAIIDKEPT